MVPGLFGIAYFLKMDGIDTKEIIALLRENNRLLKEIHSIITRRFDEKYLAEENTIDFIMNVVANIVASDLLKNKTK